MKGMDAQYEEGPYSGKSWPLFRNEEAWALAVVGYYPIDQHSQE
jgi:hypothetical protein